MLLPPETNGGRATRMRGCGDVATSRDCVPTLVSELYPDVFQAGQQELFESITDDGSKHQFKSASEDQEL